MMTDLELDDLTTPSAPAPAGPGLTAADFDALDRIYSKRVLALTSRASLIDQGCSALEAEEILVILKTDPEVFSDYTNGHCVASEDLAVEESRDFNPAGFEPEQNFRQATQSFLARYALVNNQFVLDNAAWVRGFDPVAFERHVQRTARARRYHGIEDMVLDAAGRVRSVRALVKAA